MEKRYQVFVSSTYEDLKEERQEVIQALLELDCIPAGMELFPAADEDQWTLIKKVIDDCDYYIVIVGGRYGSISPNGFSYTQMEYEYAVSRGKPIIGFLHKDPGSIPFSRTEQSEEGRTKLNAFRELVQQKMCKYWMNPSDLGSMISRSLIKLIKTKSAVGWVPGNLVPDESSSKEILRLRKQIEELEAGIKMLRTEAPKGSEYLAQGEDVIQLSYVYTSYMEEELYSKANVFREWDLAQHWEHFDSTWNDIFFYLSPVMIDEATESTMRTALNGYIFTHEYTRANEKHAKKKVKTFRISGNDFQTIKIQLRALGLITKNERQRSVKDAETYWALTPYGDTVMMQLRAIKKMTEQPDPKADT